MAINSEIADGLDELEADFPATFVWNSTSYTCLAGAESRAVGAGRGGVTEMPPRLLCLQKKNAAKVTFSFSRRKDPRGLGNGGV